jgi:hypothetical protein
LNFAEEEAICVGLPELYEYALKQHKMKLKFCHGRSGLISLPHFFVMILQVELESVFLFFLEVFCRCYCFDHAGVSFFALLALSLQNLLFSGIREGFVRQMRLRRDVKNTAVGYNHLQSVSESIGLVR